MLLASLITFVTYAFFLELKLMIVIKYMFLHNSFYCSVISGYINIFQYEVNYIA